jgi:streptomycin 6-kinase
VSGFVLPTGLVDAVRQGGDELKRRWLADLPSVVRDTADRWDLELGDPYQPGGQTAWVAPARRRGEPDPLVLKVGWSHWEAAHEADGLSAWDGAGAVRLDDAEREGLTSALLVERCEPGTTLAVRPEPEQDEVLAGILRRLHAAPVDLAGFDPLATMCADWADGARQELWAADGLVSTGRLDAALAAEGLALFRSLPADGATPVLLCTDLHAGNVLAAEREPWLVIDPKPWAGDPVYDVLQHLLNCRGRLRADPLGLVARMADLTGADPDRLRAWTFARVVVAASTWPELVSVALRLDA